MATLTLAADPIRPWSTLLSQTNQFRLRSQGDDHVVLEGTVSGLPATIEYYGTGFGSTGAGLRAGTATMDTYRYTVGGQVVVLQEGAGVTGAPLQAWLRGDGVAFERMAFRGDDLIVLSNLADTQTGYGGNDAVNGRGGNDTLAGGDGDDTLIGEAGADVLQGETGADVLRGDGEADRLYGGDGRDTLYGGAGVDTLEGGSGDDLVFGGADTDYAYGDGGLDTFSTGALRRGVELTFMPGYMAARTADGVDYLSAFERVAFTDGTLHLDPAEAAGQVWRLYGAAFGRAAETTGLSDWVRALDAGAVTLVGAADGFVGSAEFAGRYGQLDDAGFVARLYANVLGRAPDAAGLESWTALLAGGASRAEVLVGFSESAEYRAAVNPGIVNRLWTVDPEAMEVLRCYMAVLDRRPDAGGFAAWTSQRDANQLTAAEMVDAFIRSPEFQARFGALSNQDFVARLYQSALDRPADAEGLAAWTSKLDSGAMSRRDVVQGFAHSDEMMAKLLPLVSDGIAFA